MPPTVVLRSHNNGTTRGVELAADQLLRIGAFARRVGMEPTTVRAWERRYGLPRAARTVGGQRLYDEEAVRDVRRARRLVEQGWSVHRAARKVAAEARARASGAASDASRVELLRKADVALDAVEVFALVREAVESLEPAELLDEVVEPLLATGPGRLVDEILGAHLLALCRPPEGPAGEVVIAAPLVGRSALVGAAALALTGNGYVAVPLGDGADLVAAARLAEGLSARLVVALGPGDRAVAGDALASLPASSTAVEQLVLEIPDSTSHVAPADGVHHGPLRTLGAAPASS